MAVINYVTELSIIFFSTNGSEPVKTVKGCKRGRFYNYKCHICTSPHLWLGSWMKSFSYLKVKSSFVTCCIFPENGQEQRWSGHDGWVPWDVSEG